MEKLYTLKEAKKLLGVTTRTIQRWDKDGKIRTVKTIGGEYQSQRYAGFRAKGD